jgi:prepilin-type N-terminal cleavage/methylation domain-containing protein
MNYTAIRQRGFTVIETAVVILLIGLAVAFAAPRIINAVREHRLNMAVRQVSDLIQRSKATAMSENRNSSVVIDTLDRTLGLVFYDDAGAVTRTDYTPLPEGIRFERPAGVTAPVSGAPTDKSISFKPKPNTTAVYQQDFSSRGFPVVDSPTTVQALYFSNGDSFRAITITSVGGMRTWWWEEDRWVAARK